MHPPQPKIEIRVHGSSDLPTLIYLPGIHGDWTLVSSFRQAVKGRLRFVEMTYPRTATWSLEEYARGIEDALQAAGIRGGWLLGESFGSQPAWAMAGRTQRGESPLKIQGLVLAGGFVRHPWPWGAKLLRFLTRSIPEFALRGLLQVYCAYARFRHRVASDTLAAIAEFRANRLHPDDRQAMMQRYSIIIAEDYRPIARATHLPVYDLAGLIDPIVPSVLVRRWLKRNCPGWRVGKTIWLADHNVLGTAPTQAAEIILDWINAAPAAASLRRETPRRRWPR
jgi:pimeloyl-ACP methyl ester carboxylesterase